MRRNFVSMLHLFLMLFITGCNQNKPSNTKLTFHIHAGYGHKVYLETVAFSGEKRNIIDSAAIKSGNDLIIFNIPSSEQRTYKLKVSDSRLEIFFINDTPEITIEANIIKPHDYYVEHSPATISVKNFLDKQMEWTEQIKRKFALVDSLKARKTPAHILDSVSQENNQSLSEFFQQYINYADTVSSPGAFLYIYNNIDFGKDYSGLKTFVLKAAKRFPEHKRIQKLKDETISYLKIFDEEYNIGDYLPELTLPDKNGVNFSTHSLKGKYVFMDFWSTLCNDCIRYDREKIKAKKLFTPDKFEIVSIALDPEKVNWKNYLERKKYNWPQLIDEKMWNGEVVRLFRIDSIPFNFFLAPDGKILSKAIKPDSVITILSKMIK
jgi:thiol-disulfide isomerase/thioredoxin